MAAQLMDGNVVAKRIKDEVARDMEALKVKGIIPSLAAVQVGDNPESKMYVGMQKKNCEAIGLVYNLHTLPADTSETALVRYIEKLNSDRSVNGIILQMPLPQGINPRSAQKALSPAKDVEGMNPSNLGMLLYGNPKIGPCTALSVMELLRSTGENLKGREAVVVGHSEIVGKPVAILLLQWLTDSPTVTVCHIATKDLESHIRRADIIISAVGKPGLIKPEWVKEGAIIVLVGIKRLPDGTALGDVDFEPASAKASWITPVKGGVGPVTTAILLRNTVEVTKMQLGI
ncbi:bifunctional 5,10-methylene-tetrahydrofolate dehydrogenase/5,10-methylene-tetrahydrofolate cyclohydrolase [Candidatus Desantisbacteria bacterium CG_4_10_14_0_8_um_filter_48_22]|uniref:Bifunctional protein FolD n=1 Tax=Candidatus Desantisbacteria bacterium CG_4_10_14_0_8_um_filter_48_22 TaxID=1974543 RepID=A0A2M7SD54_9BACT|nr:MAG: bifunctional 5,10-methylene-tetrahydrofolate dehydrogenase/5,10-methylene-tetrahydrofolate cyclohydrolase [Candidatus Desantisbacteria bacterium CG1_02_49_89]PIV57371.1 MAG: bifunctional 5,10-methylene-tetrahydrofolate dehydrogenase/5,10-methylene-tetrahydrofolate cyclohydrolase [Candidatus Desantisbacteria bacterium CG02_land_8_20_14_3_00_49_13]PIZ17455.1 MAG: bifunctional 5,10-methylene-tetrahydrofolate dehydrogenase/5,10-methylene-tetrahydrofolate cyclohydrolase [Candidatus Desantisbac